MKIIGQYESDFEFILARLHIGQRDGKDIVQISFPQLGDMNNNTSDAVITSERSK